MRLGWALAAVVLLAGCGGGASDSEGLPGTPKVSDKPLPTPDPGTRAQAKKALDEAYDRLISDGTGRYRSAVDLAGSEMVAEGSYDIDRTRSRSRLVQPALGRDGAENDEFAMRGMVIDRHVYGGPEFGPFQRCWFDYGVGNLAAITGVKDAPENPDPWIPAAVVVPTEARALGFVDGRSDVIAVEVFADTAVSVVFNKLLGKVYDQLPEEQAWSRATLTLKDGRFSELTFRMTDALGALESAGVDFAAVDGAEQPIELMRKVAQTTTYDRFGDPVDIQAPPADQLMDASGITPDNPEDPELCEAAR